MSGSLSKARSSIQTRAHALRGSSGIPDLKTPPNLATLPALHPTLSTVCKFCRRGPWTMNDGPALDYEPLPPGPSPPGDPTVPSLDGYTEQGAALVFVGLLLVLLVVLLVRCFRVLLDPFSRMPSSSWTDHKEGLERGQFEYALV